MNNMAQWDPFSEISALQKQFFDDDWLMPLKNINVPTTDVYTTNGSLVVEAHLPNFEEKDIDVQVGDRSLTISAQHYEAQTAKDKRYLVRESSSSFYRRIALPERADTENVQASLENGILRVTLPLATLPEPKKVAISAKSK